MRIWECLTLDPFAYRLLWQGPSLRCRATVVQRDLPASEGTGPVKVISPASVKLAFSVITHASSLFAGSKTVQGQDSSSV